MKSQLLKWLNFVLMLDLFFVLFSFSWFAIALIGRATQVPLGIDLWLKLWDPVFQPALGILMAGALLSGLVSWLNQRFGTSRS